MQTNFFLIITVAILYFVTGELSLQVLNGKNIVNIGVFAAEGFSLAFALYFGRKVLAGIFLGQLALALFNGVSFEASFMVSLVNTLEAYIAIVLFRKFHLHTELTTFRDILGLGTLILFVLQPFSAIVSNLFLLFFAQVSMEHFFSSVFSWWFGNVMGQMLFTPFLLLLFSNKKKIHFSRFFIYGTLFFIYTYILQIEFAIENSLLLLSLSLPVVVIVMEKEGMEYGALFSVIVALTSSYAVYNKIGAFSINSHFDNVINYNLFVLSHIVIVFSVGILFKERKEYSRRLEETVKQEIRKNQQQQLLMLQQSRLAQMGEMISMIAHQWRQPLNNLSLINQLLITKYAKGNLDDTAMEYFKENSKKQINLMTTTIDDFRNFFKKENQPKEFCIYNVIEDVIDMTEAVYTKNGIEIVLEIEKNYKVMGYANGVAQVLLNIINNAKDALIERGISEKKIVITTHKVESDKLKIVIRDNAGGIPLEIMDKIFDPYFSTKEEKNGTGLGLYMSKMIIQKQIKGSIDVCNDSAGAMFVIHMPGLKGEC